MEHNSISSGLIAQFNLRVYEESIPRIIKVLRILPDDKIWYAPNEQANSIGHLILHLVGNVTQWIGSGIGNREDNRKRSLEFTSENQFSRKDLETKLWQLKSLTDQSFIFLKDDDLLENRKVQGFDESVLSIIIHVIEHFSYHTGQIAIIAKYLTGADLGFYEGLDLSVTT